MVLSVLEMGTALQPKMFEIELGNYSIYTFWLDIHFARALNDHHSPCVQGKYRFKVQTRSDDGIGSDRDIHRTISTMKSKKNSGLF